MVGQSRQDGARGARGIQHVLVSGRRLQLRHHPLVLLLLLLRLCSLVCSLGRASHLCVSCVCVVCVCVCVSCVSCVFVPREFYAQSAPYTEVRSVLRLPQVLACFVCVCVCVCRVCRACRVLFSCWGWRGSDDHRWLSAAGAAFVPAGLFPAHAGLLARRYTIPTISLSLSLTQPQPLSRLLAMRA
jgi:hypothetical protein